MLCIPKKWAFDNSAGANHLLQNVASYSDLQFAMTLTIYDYHIYITFLTTVSVAQLDAPSDWRPGGRGFNPRRGRQHSFVEIDHEIFSMVILPFR